MGMVIMNRYNVITTIDIEQMQMNADGGVMTITLPAGTVINTILWDGVSDWTPPENTKVEPA
jgi:hypothetical protein